jgi:hypothetical protein
MQKEYTISLEAKSHKTLGALLPTWNSKDLLLGIKIGFLSAAVSIYLFSAIAWYWITLLAIFAFIIGLFVSFLFLAIVEPDHFKSMAVIDQVHQYPANEKWIAISKDSLNLTSYKKADFYRRSNYENFLRIARKNKIGILVISRSKEEILVELGFFKGEYLDCYCIAGNIRKEVYSETLAS